MKETYTTAEKLLESLKDSETWPEGPLKQVLIDYVGESQGSANVTVEMIVETMAEEFPEFLMLMAEENFIRGYQQAIHDVDEGQKLLDKYNKDETENDGQVLTEKMSLN